MSRAIFERLDRDAWNTSGRRSSAPVVSSGRRGSSRCPARARGRMLKVAAGRPGPSGHGPGEVTPGSVVQGPGGSPPSAKSGSAWPGRTVADMEDEMSDPPDVHRNLDHCMQSIKGASEAMAHDMLDAAMRLGAAEMMLASASHAVRKHAAAQVPPGTGAGPGDGG
jgi:hypothetical protein